MFKSNRGTVSGYFLAGRFMTWLPVSEILCFLVDWVVDQACTVVKMAKYWPIGFFMCVFMDRGTVKIHKRAKRTRSLNYNLVQIKLNLCANNKKVKHNEDFS